MGQQTRRSLFLGLGVSFGLLDKACLHLAWLRRRKQELPFRAPAQVPIRESVSQGFHEASIPTPEHAAHKHLAVLPERQERRG